jgi:flagellar protein FliS
VNSYGRYSQAYKKAAVSTVDQRKLIVMLYDGAIKFLTIAVDKLGKGDTYEAHRNLIRGKSIIAELLASLNMEAGGEIARNLQRLYTYMFNELIEANLNSDAERVGLVIGLLKELRVGWAGMQGQEQDPEPGQAPAQPASPKRATKNINIRF